MDGQFWRKLPFWWSEKLFAGSVEQRAPGSRLRYYVPAVILIVLAGLLFYARLFCPLLEPEEARYAEIPRQMLAEGRWLVPVLHGADYLQKPPLLYWLIMLSYQFFGVHDWAARLVPTTAGILVVLAVYAWARRTVGPRAALMSAIILCLSARFLYLGGMVSMDGLLCACVIGALACGHIARAPIGKVSRVSLGRRWWLASALCCGLGIMTKGPVAAVLVVGPLLAWTWLDRRGPRVRLGWWISYLGVVCLVAAPWYIAIALHDPQATGTFFWLHNLVRYWAAFDHEKPAWFYLPGVLGGMLPWTLMLVPMGVYLRRQGRRWARRRPAALGFFLLAFLWCVAFFSLSGCKRAAYILPALPCLALALGTYLTRAFTWHYLTKPMWVFGTAATAVLLLAASLLWLPQYHRKFGFGDAAGASAAVANVRAVACYPKRWDSVSFYLGRAVPFFSPNEIDPLIALVGHGDTLLFVKNDRAVSEVKKALPAGLRFVPCAGLGCNANVGVVRRNGTGER